MDEQLLSGGGDVHVHLQYHRTREPLGTFTGITALDVALWTEKTL